MIYKLISVRGGMTRVQAHLSITHTIDRHSLAGGTFTFCKQFSVFPDLTPRVLQSVHFQEIGETYNQLQKPQEMLLTLSTRVDHTGSMHPIPVLDYNVTSTTTRVYPIANPLHSQGYKIYRIL